MAAPFQNVYNVRRVAETDSKPCTDFFPACQGHLSDKGFASPVVKPSAPPPSAEVLEKKRKEALEREIELVKKEYEEKQKRKKEKDEEKDSKDDKDKSKESSKEGPSETTGKTEALPEVKKDEAPKLFALHRDFYNMRLQRLRQQHQARKTWELLKNPGAFPAAPKGPIG